MISAVAAAAATAASAAAGAPVAVPGVFSLLAILNLGNTTLGRIIMGVVNFYVLLIIVWALFSWFDHSKGFLRDVYNVLDALVRPYMDLFRRFIPTAGGMDFSPIVAIIVLQVVARLIVN